jgi:hypothetical protein
MQESGSAGNAGSREQGAAGGLQAETQKEGGKAQEMQEEFENPFAKRTMANDDLWRRRNGEVAERPLAPQQEPSSTPSRRPPAAANSLVDNQRLKQKKVAHWIMAAFHGSQSTKKLAGQGSSLPQIREKQPSLAAALIAAFPSTPLSGAGRVEVDGNEAEEGSIAVSQAEDDPNYGALLRPMTCTLKSLHAVPSNGGKLQ